MALIVRTEDPDKLLDSIKEKIDEGEIETWAYDREGDFTHTRPQWERRAWLRPSVREDRLVFSIIPAKQVGLSRTLYGIYHGRFMEMLLNHFDTDFVDARATAMPRYQDTVK